MRSSLAALAPRLGLATPPNRVEEALNGVLDSLRKGEPYNWWLLVFDNADEPEELQGPVQEVVHYLGDPEAREGGETRIIADMGTAPLEAWQDLLDACAACGAKKVTVGEAAAPEEAE